MIIRVCESFLIDCLNEGVRSNDQEGRVDSERTPHLPPKAKLSWRISRLSLSPDGSSWCATGWKGNRVAVIRLPALTDARLEEAWLAQIESSFELGAIDATHPNSY